jgi:hypothetical protein
MFRVKKGYEGKVSTKGYLGLITEAPQDILEHLYHIGHKSVEVAPQPKKKRKAKEVNKPIDNAEGNDLPKLDDND